MVWGGCGGLGRGGGAVAGLGDGEVVGDGHLSQDL